MSANVETMFYAGKPVWHGMGTKVESALSSADALKMAGLDWIVESQPVQVVDGSVIDGIKANVRSSDQKVLGVVTDRYRIIQNEEAFAFTDMLLGEGVRYETAGSLSSGKRVWLLAKMDTAEICGDSVEPYLVFTNSHDGSGSIKVAVTPIRVVCQNTLTLALRKAQRTWGTRHMGNIVSKLEEAKQTLGFAKTYMEQLKIESEKLTEIVVLAPQFADFLQKMFPIPKDASDRQKRNIEEQRVLLADIYNHKTDIQKFHGTAYGIINAIADYVPHTTPKRLTANYQENNFMSIVDGGKTSLMERACSYFS